MTHKVLIANRGEIACRVAAACEVIGVSSVAVYSDADEDLPHVQSADTAYRLGPSPAQESYLDTAAVMDAIAKSGATAVHPGYGFLSENTAFAEMVRQAGLVWIGPDPKSIKDMGDKERARLLAEAAGVPILPGSGRFAPGDLAGLDEAADKVGFPLLVKGSGGGGGIGMNLVEDPSKLEATVARTQELAIRAFGDGTVYLERFVQQGRHVEVQIFGFGDGEAIHMFERDCSIQRRHQKVIEEAPAPGLPTSLVEDMHQAAVALAAQERYRGPGTVEFLVDPAAGTFFFLEMNTRIQVEHPVTEAITGVDLVALQLRQALDLDFVRPLQSDIRRQGHAIECRLYAEKPEKNFLPSPGPLNTLNLPATGDGIRVDTGYREGNTVTPYYDPMIAKLIVLETDRSAAIERTRAVLADCEVEGLSTNITYMDAVLRSETFADAQHHTSTGIDIAQILKRRPTQKRPSD